MKITTVEKLFHVKLEDHPNMEQYLNEILCLSQKLAAIEPR
jgi:hypothetical protein